jgi:hypothetical protein
MLTNDMKNIVILKNIPSNLVEEAIVVLKDNIKVKDVEYIDEKKDSPKRLNKQESKNYIVKEAELIVSQYIEKVERNKLKHIDKLFIASKKYKRIKYSLIVFTTFLCIDILIRILF